MAQVALAWVLHNPAVCAPIVGATRSHHLPEAIAALELKLTGDEIAMLEKPYSNHGPSWYEPAQRPRSAINPQGASPVVDNIEDSPALDLRRSHQGP